MQEILRVLPHHFEPVHSDGVWIVPTPEVDIKIALEERFRGTNGFRHLGHFQDLPVLLSGVAIEETGTISEPIPSKSPESKAGYLLWKEFTVGNEKILVAVHMLGSFTMTSNHKHSSSGEIFRRLVGKLYSYHNEGVERVENQLRIKPGDSHLSFTTDQPALTLLVQRGQEIKHDYVKQPDYEFLRERADLLDKSLGY